MNADIWNTIFSSGFYMPGNFMGTAADFMGLAGGQAAQQALGDIAQGPLGPALAGPLGAMSSFGNSVDMGLGRAALVGPLSVPPSWTAAAPARPAVLDAGSNADGRPACRGGRHAGSAAGRLRCTRLGAQRPSVRLSPHLRGAPTRGGIADRQRVSATRPFSSREEANDDRITGLRHASARSQLGSDVLRGGVGPDAGRRISLAWACRRIAFDGNGLQLSALGADRPSMAWSVVGDDGGCGRALRGVAEHHCGAGRADRGTGRGRCGGLRGRVRGHGAPAGDRGEPCPADGPCRDQLLGQNTPAIAATEAQYAEMWAQDAAAMYGYAGSSAAASQLTSFIRPEQVASCHRADGPGRGCHPGCRHPGGHRAERVVTAAVDAARRPAKPGFPGFVGLRTERRPRRIQHLRAGLGVVDHRPVRGPQRRSPGQMAPLSETS